MAHKKGVGSTDNGRDSNAKRLGVKLFGGQLALAGNIIVRQRGTKYHVGENVYLGKDHTIHAKVAGTVAFNKRRLGRTFVSIIPFDVDETVAKPTPKPKAKKAAPILDTAAKVAGAVVGTAQGVAEVVSGSKVALPSGKKIKVDDLTAIEGIGPKIAELLNNDGITTWAELAAASFDRVKGVLTNAGSRYQMHNPKTWAKQADLAANGKWAELEALQDRLDGGVDPDDK